MELENGEQLLKIQIKDDEAVLKQGANKKMFNYFTKYDYIVCQMMESEKLMLALEIMKYHKSPLKVNDLSK